MTDVVPTYAGVDTSQFSFDELLGLDQQSTGEHYKFESTTHLKGDKKPLLIGVTHVITSVTFQTPVEVKKGQDPDRGYVTVEATVASEGYLLQQIRQGKIPNVESLEGLGVRPNERIVYNDGSTGIRRQLVAMLNFTGHIKVDDVIETDDVYDRPWTEWLYTGDQTKVYAAGKDEERTVPSFDRKRNGDPLVIPVMNGLRASYYPNPGVGGGESVTYYLG